MDILIDYYLWIKAFHIIFMVTWMAGIFYLPRLFVYHSGIPVEDKTYATFLTMERRLLRGIMLPSIILTFIFGILLLLTPGVVDMKHDGWFHTKFFLVLLLAGFHGWMKIHYKRFLTRSPAPAKASFYRMVNEIPAVLLIAIVLLVVLKPF